jgi:hypothetical protein
MQPFANIPIPLLAAAGFDPFSLVAVVVVIGGVLANALKHRAEAERNRAKAPTPGRPAGTPARPPQVPQSTTPPARWTLNANSGLPPLETVPVYRGLGRPKADLDARLPQLEPVSRRPSGLPQPMAPVPLRRPTGVAQPGPGRSRPRDIVEELRRRAQAASLPGASRPNEPRRRKPEPAVIEAELVEPELKPIPAAAGPQPSAAAPPPDALTADQLRAWLANPQQVRSAFVLSEILAAPLGMRDVGV